MKALVVAILAALGGSVHASPKPTLAIAEIEPSDPESGALATALTKTLQGVKSPTYTMKSTPKQVAAAVTKAECMVTRPSCAVEVGAALGVDYVLTGEVTRRGKHQVLVLSLVKVATKQRVRSLRETAATSVDAKRWGADAFKKLVDAQLGELVLVTNAPQGEIVIDGQTAGALFSGRATIGGLAIGTHLVVIRARGFRPFELEVAIDGTTKQNVLLEPEP